MPPAWRAALSDKTTGGTAASSGSQNGFDIDIASLLAGNTITVNYTDTATGTAHTFTFVRVDDPSALPLSDSATTDPNDTVVGIDFSGGMSSVVSQINTALGSAGVVASNPSGTTLEILDDGLGNAVVNSVSSTATVTSLSGGSGELPFFTDGTQYYTGAFTAEWAAKRRPRRPHLGEQRADQRSEQARRLCGRHRGRATAPGRTSSISS